MASFFFLIYKNINVFALFSRTFNSRTVTKKPEEKRFLEQLFVQILYFSLTLKLGSSNSDYHELNSNWISIFGPILSILMWKTNYYLQMFRVITKLEDVEKTIKN